jgi:hypothetical protein
MRPDSFRGRATEALRGLGHKRQAAPLRGGVEMHGLPFAASDTGVWLNTRTTPSPGFIKTGTRRQLTVPQYASSCRYSSPLD